MRTANIYLNFDGNCEEAFLFYRSVIGGEFNYVGRFGEMPPQEGMPPMPQSMADKIMHISLPVSKETILMGSDTGDQWSPNFTKGNNFSIYLAAESRADADRLFAGLSEGGKVTMPLSDTFWGDYFGSFEDKFGVNWMVSHSSEQAG